MFAAAETMGGSVGSVGATSLGGMQIDLAAVEHTPHGGRRVLALGEVKARSTRVGPEVLDRLDAACAALVSDPPARTQVDGSVKRILVSRAGFTNDLRRRADRRPDVELVDLDRLYHGE